MIAGAVIWLAQASPKQQTSHKEVMTSHTINGVPIPLQSCRILSTLTAYLFIITENI